MYITAEPGGPEPWSRALWETHGILSKKAKLRHNHSDLIHDKGQSTINFILLLNHRGIFQNSFPLYLFESKSQRKDYFHISPISEETLLICG